LKIIATGKYKKEFNWIYLRLQVAQLDRDRHSDGKHKDYDEF